MAFKNYSDLNELLKDNDVYTGEYIKTMTEKDFATLDGSSKDKIKKMAALGAQQSMQKSLSKIESQAKSLGYNVFYEFDKSTNEVTVVLADKQLDAKKDYDKIKQEAPKFKLSLGEGTRGGKGRMAAPKSYAPHLIGGQVAFVTQIEETIGGISHQLSQLNRKSNSNQIQYAIRNAQKLAEQSIVTTEGYSIVDEKKFREEMKNESSNARGTFTRTNLRLGGLIGEVVKKSNFTKKIASAQKLTKNELKKLNEKADDVVTKYVAIFSQEGEAAADAYFNSVDYLKKDFKMTEDDIKEQLKIVKQSFGDFLSIPSTFGLSGDSALQTKKFSYAGDRDIAFRPLYRTGRHSSQTRNYLERSKTAAARASKRAFERFIPSIDKGNISYYKESGHQLYKRGLVSGGNIKGVEYSAQELVTKAYEDSVKEYIAEKIEKLKQSKKYLKSNQKKQRQMEKEVEERAFKSLPSIAQLGILEDAGLMSQSVSKEFESKRLVTSTISGDEYDKLKKEAKEKYEKFSDKVKEKVGSLEGYQDSYVAKKALGRNRLTNVQIFGGLNQDDSVSIEAKEFVSGNTAKLLSRYTGARETDVAIPDFIFNKMTEKLGIAGANIISAAKKFKAEEIPGYIQGFLSAAISAGKVTSEQVVKDLYKLGFKAEIGAGGEIFIDNSDEAVKNIDWNRTLKYLDDIGILKQTKDGFEFADITNKKTIGNIKSAIIEDVVNRADTYNSSKPVKAGPKEYESIKRDIAEARASSKNKDKFKSLEKDITKMYDPTQGVYSEQAIKARGDIKAILDEKTGSVAMSYKTALSGQDRGKDVKNLQKQSYKGRKKRGNHYIISIGKGSGYTIDASQLEMAAINYQDAGGLLTKEEYKKTVLGTIDNVKNEIILKDRDAIVDVMVDPGTDFGFGMSFDDDGKNEQGAVGRFLVLPNIQIDTVQKEGQTLYSLPSYNKEFHSLIGSIRDGRYEDQRSQKAQELNQKIFNEAHSSDGGLWIAANTKRIPGSTSGHITGISRSAVEEARKRGDKEVAKRLMSDIWVSEQVMQSMLVNKKSFTESGGTYKSDEHMSFLENAIEYLYGKDQAKNILDNLSGDDEDDKKILAKKIVSAIKDDTFSGKMKGLVGIMNRYPTIARHSVAFAELHVSSELQGNDVKVGAALAKFANGDYDGDTLQIVLGLMSNGKSFEEADEMVQRQREKNVKVYEQLLKEQTVDKTLASSTDVKKLSDPKYMGLSALAAKFNKPYTGMFSNISTRIRKGLMATGFDVLDEQGNPVNLSTADDYINVIRGELVSGVGQILEQDSISAKKVEQRLDKARQAKGRDLTPEEEAEEQQKVLHEFEELYNMIRDPKFQYSDIIESMQGMGLFGSEATQISSTLSANILSMLSGLSDADRKNILSQVGLTDDILQSGVLSSDIFKNAGVALENMLIDPNTGKSLKIFAGEYGTGLATSRSFTPYMKQDTYELLRFLKSLEDVNDVLKKTGEIIDENGNSFNRYGEKVRGARDSLHLEAAQESQKVIIAGNEARAISESAKQYDALAQNVSDAEKQYKNSQFLSAHDIANTLFPLNAVRYGEADPKETERTLSRGIYLSDLATFGEKGERTKKSVDRYKAALLALGNSKTEADNIIFQEAKVANQLKSVQDKISKGFTDAQTFGEVPLTSTTVGKRKGVADAIIVGNEGVTIVEQKTGSGKNITGNQKIQPRVYQAMLEIFRQEFGNFYEKETGKNFGFRNQNGILDYTNLINQFFGLKNIQDIFKRVGIKEEDLDYFKQVFSKILSAGGGQKDKDDKSIMDRPIGVTVSFVGSDNKLRTWSGGNQFDRTMLFDLINNPLSLTDREIALLTSGTETIYGEDGSVTTKKSRGNKRRVSSSRKKFDRISEAEKILKQREKLFENLDDLADKQKTFTKGSEEYESYGSAIETVALKIVKLDDAFDKLKQDKRLGDNKKTTIASLEEQYNVQYKIFKAQKEAAEQRKKERDEQSELNNALGEYERTLKAVTKYEQIQKAATQKANLSTGRARTTQLQIAQDAAALAERYRGQQRGIESSDIYKNNQKQFANVFGDWLLTNELAESQTEGQNRGARNIFDVIGNDVKRAFQRITDFGLAARILNKVQKEIANVYQNILKLNEAMTDIRIVTGASVDEANSLMTSYNKLAKELGTTTTEVAKSASEWMRQGYSASESVNLITSSVKLARLGFMDMSSATTSLTAVLKGFNLQATESSEIVDKLTKLDAEYATTAGDIATALSRTAAAAKAANLDLDQTAAMLTTIIDITQQDAGSVGNALKTILSRYGNVKAGVFAGMEEDGEDTSDSLNDVEKVLNAIGIQIRSTSTEMRGFDEVLDDLAEKWDNLNDVEQNAVATAMAGVRQRNQFLALMQNYNQYKESLESSRTSSGTADEKYAAVMDSIATSMQRIQTAWEGFTQKLKASGFVKGFFEAIAGVVENMNVILPIMVSFLSTILVKQLPALGTKIDDLFGQPIRKFSSEAKELFRGKKEGKTAADYYKESSEERFRKAQQNMNPYQKGMLSKMEILEKEVRGIATNNKVDTSKIQEKPLYFDGMTRIGANRFYNKKIEELSSRYHNYNSAPYKVQNYLHKMYQKTKSDPNYKMLPFEKRLYDKYGYIEDIDPENKEINRQYELYMKTKNKETATRMIGTGLMTGISSGMTANYGDFTNTGDKVLTGAISGGIAAIGSAFGPIGSAIGSIAGPLIGQLAGKGLYEIFHKEEIARRKRVDEAKEQLKSIQNIESVVTSAEGLTGKDRSEWGSEEYKQEKEYRAQMLETLGESSSLYDNFKKLGGVIDGELTPEMVALYKSAQLMTEAQETYKSKEEERYDLLNKVNSAEYSLIQDIQDDPLNLELRAKYEEKYNKTVEQGVAQFEQLNIKLKTINDNLHETMLKGAFYSGGFSSYTSSDLRNVSLERMVIEQAREWAKKDPTANIFDENGNIYKSAYDTIISEFKTHENYNVITKKESYNLANSIKNEDWLKQYYKDGISGYNELYQFINTQSEDKIRDFLGVATYEDAKYIIDKINKSNPENISNIAHALNLTADQARGLKDLIGFVTLGDVMGSDTEFLSKFETLGNIFSDLSEDSELTAENLQKIISKYPDLLFGEDGSVSQDNIIKNITSMIANPEGGLGLAYAGKIAKGAQTRTDLWDIFKTSAEKNGISGDVLKKIKDAKDFESANIEWTEELMDMWSSVVAAATPIETYVDEERDKVIELENKLLDKQIDNLQSIKDQLGDINKQRQKELDLIKARDELENAKKEKKLVYRAGIGFVAQADTSAIQEAQDKVDELERQQTEEDLQYQIDQLNQQKAILEAIQNNESLNRLANTVEWIKNGLGIDENHSNIIDALQKMSSQEYADKIREQIVSSIKNNTGASNADANNSTGGGSLGVDNPDAKREKITMRTNGLWSKDVRQSTFDSEQSQITFAINHDDLKVASDSTRANLHTQKEFSDSKVQAFFAKRKKDGTFGRFQSWRDNEDNIQYYDWIDLPDDVLVVNTYDDDKIWYKNNGKLYTVQDPQMALYDSHGAFTGFQDISSNATGSYDYSGGKTYINELGTEAIVTPQGTLTSLPSHSGIVPADLTKNLFALGEIAPNLIATLRNQMPNVSKSNSTSNDNSTNIGTVYATFNADSGFDMNRFMIDLRSAAGNTRHNN